MGVVLLPYIATNVALMYDDLNHLFCRLRLIFASAIAEFLATRDDLKIFCWQGWCRLLSVEADSKSADCWAQGGVKPPWQFHYIAKSKN